MKTGLLAASLKDKVQPDMEELTDNMEENEAEQKKKSEEAEKKAEPKLGNLTYKFEYDFQKGEVSFTPRDLESIIHYKFSSEQLECSRYLILRNLIIVVILLKSYSFFCGILRIGELRNQRRHQDFGSGGGTF